MILGISSGGMCPQSMLHGHTRAYHSCPGYSAVYASIALVIACLCPCTTSCGKSAIIGAVAAAVVAGVWCCYCCCCFCCRRMSGAVAAAAAAVAGVSEVIVHLRSLAWTLLWHASVKVACPIIHALQFEQ